MKATIAQTPVKYNQIPKESVLLKRIPPLGKGERVQYRVYGAFDPSKPDKFFGRTLVLPSEDTVFDTETGEVFDIAFIDGIGTGGIPQIGTIIFEDFNACIITLFGDSAIDQRKYQYIELCNYLADNPNRDTTKPILIERIDENKDVNYKRSKRQKVQGALQAVASMTDEEVLNFIRANRMPDAGTPVKRRVTLEDLAENNPDKFIEMPLLDYTALYTQIDDAKKAKIIVWNNVTREWQRYDGKLIMQVKKGFGISQKEELAQFLMKTEGRNDLDWIKKELAK